MHDLEQLCAVVLQVTKGMDEKFQRMFNLLEKMEQQMENIERMMPCCIE